MLHWWNDRAQPMMKCYPKWFLWKLNEVLKLLTDLTLQQFTLIGERMKEKNRKLYENFNKMQQTDNTNAEQCMSNPEFKVEPYVTKQPQLSEFLLILSYHGIKTFLILYKIGWGTPIVRCKLMLQITTTWFFLTKTISSSQNLYFKTTDN